MIFLMWFNDQCHSYVGYTSIQQSINKRNEKS